MYERMGLSAGMMRCAIAVSLTLAVAGCGSASATAPSSSRLGAPTALRIVSQRVTLTSNDVVLAWSGSASSFRLGIGSSRNGSDVQVIDLTQSSYTFIAPRTGNTYYARVQAIAGTEVSLPSDELTISTVDLRDVIDAMFFRAGPMSEEHAIQFGSTPAAVWPDGTRLRVLVSPEAGERIRSLAQTAIDDYASVVGGAVTGRAEFAADDGHALANAEQLPAFTIFLRIWQGRCGGTGCANYGPAPLGPNASIVTLDNADLTNAVAHELGHAYGLAHVLRPNDRPEFGFLMNPVAGGPGLSETEKNAIAAARAGGVRAGTTRDQALAYDLVRPYSQMNGSTAPRH